MKIMIPCHVFEKIMFWVDKADFEVSGFGKAVFDGTNFQVLDAILLKQTGSGTHTDIDPLSLSKVQYELRETPGELRFWWHSHVNMNTFMSGTDQTTLKELGSQGWAIATVFNKRREVTSALSYKYKDLKQTPFGTTDKEETFYDDKLQTLIVYPALTDAQKVELTTQFDENVQQKKFGSASHKAGKFDSWLNYTWYEREAAEALGLTPYTYREEIKECSPEEIVMYRQEVDAYWIKQRGYAPYYNQYTAHGKNLPATTKETPDQRFDREVKELIQESGAYSGDYDQQQELRDAYGYHD